jgi:RNA polymerase I-specific transcription initiation factor RRN3
MGLIINRLVELDAQMQVDFDDLDNDLVAFVTREIENDAYVDGMDDDDDDADSIVSENEVDKRTKKAEAITLLILKIDGILDRLFTYYAPYFEKPDTESSHDKFHELLYEFVNSILPTRSSRHSQFLLFHFSQQSASLTDKFAGTLLSLTFDPNQRAATRQAAAEYLGSFISRGKLVSAKITRDVLNVLCHRLEEYRQHVLATCRGPDLHRYRNFYCWFQALMYIFCFRWQDLVDGAPDTVDPDEPSSYYGKELQWMPRLKETIQAAVHSSLNPLKVCAPEIVSLRQPRGM